MKFQSYLCSPPTYVYNCRAVNTHITLLSNKNPWETNFIFFSLQEAARLAFLKASEGLVNLCALNIMSLLPFVLLNFRGGYHYSDKISTKVSSAQEFWLRLKDSGQREAALLWQGFTHTDQQETATSFFFWVPREFQLRAVLSALYCWICGWCHCGPPHCGLCLDKHMHIHTNHAHHSPQTMAMETWPAAVFTFILERFLRWDANSS